MTVTLEVIEKMPEAAEAERIVLGSMLLDTKHLDAARVWLTADDFFLDSNRRIFRAMAKLDDLRTGVDPVTLGQYLQDSKELQAVGGQAYVSGLTDGFLRKGSIDDYVKIVKEKARLRRIIKIADQAINRAADQNEKAIEIISGIQDGIQTVLDDSDADNPHVSAYTIPALEKFEHDRRLDRGSGISFGLPKLDLMTGGMRDGEVCIVGARPGVGKTSFVCQVIAENCPVGIGCDFYSLEMMRERILHRLWAIVSGVPFARIRRPWLTNVDDAARIREAAATVAEWPLRIHDKADLHVSQICASARNSIRRHGARLVAVDYAQEVSADGRDERTKTMAVARGLTRMIKHEPATLMLLSQLIKGNRDTYNTPPVVSDLIESGKLENVAHVVLLLHRGWDDEKKKIADEGNIFVPKQREGDTGSITIKFNRRNVTFEEAV